MILKILDLVQSFGITYMETSVSFYSIINNLNLNALQKTIMQHDR